MKSRVRRINKVQILLVLLATLLALAIRLYRLDHLPPGLAYDEAAHAIDAVHISARWHPVFFERNTGREPIFIYLIYLVFKLVGVSAANTRLVSAVIGTSTVPVIAYAGWSLFADEGARKARRIALLSAFLLATAYWHICFSRLAFRAILLPLVASLSFAFFWWGWCLLTSVRPHPVRSALPTLIVAGLLLGVSLYTYTASRFLPIVIAVFCLAAVILSPRTERRKRGQQAGLAVSVVGGSAFLAFIPLGLYFVSHPTLFTSHASYVSIFNPAFNGGSPFRALLTSVYRTAGMFFFLADENTRHNPASRPVLDPIGALFLTIGLLLSIRRSKQRPAHLFVLCWFFVMALPAVLTASGLPHSLRSFGMVPATYLLVAIGLEGAMERIAALRSWREANTVAIVLIAISGVIGVRDYFTGITHNRDVRGAFAVNFADVGRAMRASGDSVPWLIPTAGYFELPSSTHYTIDFFSEGHPYYQIPSLPNVAPTMLGDIIRHDHAVNLVHWTRENLEGLYYYGDSRGLIAFLLDKYGQRRGKDTYGGFSVTRYWEPKVDKVSLATEIQPRHINFANKFELAGIALGRAVDKQPLTDKQIETPAVPAGAQGWAVLRWTTLSTIRRDYKVSVRVVDPQGHLVAQSDELLQSNDYPFIPEWPANDTSYSYHLFTIEPWTPAGSYVVKVVVYDAITGEQLDVLDDSGVPRGQEIRAGAVDVLPTVDIAPSSSIATPLATPVALVPEVQLLGYELPADRIEQGQSLSLALFSKKVRATAENYEVLLRLRGPSNREALEVVQPLAYGTYPIPRWQVGETVRDWHDFLVLPQQVAPGEYRLTAALRPPGATEATLEQPLATIHIRKVTRQFEPPPIPYLQKADLEGKATLLGYRLSSTRVQAGKPLTLTLFWRDEKPFSKSYTVFTHLLGPDGRLWGQHDGIPASTQRPTTSWLPGEVISDSHPLTVDQAAPLGSYRIEIGLYDTRTGQRMLAMIGGEKAGVDHVVLSTPVEVRTGDFP
jgi:hypothetical protein